MVTGYTYTATDADDDTVTLPFDITVEADATPAFADGETIADQNYIMRARRFPRLTLPAVETDGNGATTYTLTPALSAGLTFDGAANPPNIYRHADRHRRGNGIHLHRHRCG